MINIKESKSHVIFGSLLIIFGIGVFIFPYIYNQYQEKQEELKIEQFFYKETSKEENINLCKVNGIDTFNRKGINSSKMEKELLEYINVKTRGKGGSIFVYNIGKDV